MLKTGAKPEQVVQNIEKAEQMLSAAGNMIVNSSPLLSAVNTIAQSGNFEAITEMAKAQFKQNQ